MTTTLGKSSKFPMSSFSIPKTPFCERCLVDYFSCIFASLAPFSIFICMNSYRINVANNFPVADQTLDHGFHVNIIPYCQQNWYARLAVYIDLFTKNTTLLAFSLHRGASDNLST